MKIASNFLYLIVFCALTCVGQTQFKSCVVPPHPKNGHWRLHQSQCGSTENCSLSQFRYYALFPVGSQLIYTCNFGYRTNGPNSAYCGTEGKWVSIPFCEPIPCEPLNTLSTIAVCTYNNEVISCENKVPPTTVAVLACQVGYEESSLHIDSSNRERTIICNQGGQWSEDRSICIPASNATLSTAVSRTRSVTPTPASYTDPGMTPVEGHCMMPPVVQNGYWRIDPIEMHNCILKGVCTGNRLSLIPGMHLIYSCKSGYRIQGPQNVSCGPDGRWSGVTSCERIDLPPAVASSSVTAYSTATPSTAVSLTTSSTVLTPTSHPAPTDIPIERSCMVPPQPTNGHWKLHMAYCDTQEHCELEQGVYLQVGAALVYSCNSGYRLNGAVNVFCGRQRNFLNIPTCDEIRCAPLSTASIHAECIYDGETVNCGVTVKPGTTARLSCRHSYRQETSFYRSRTVACTQNGVWKPQPIQCVPICGITAPKLEPEIVNGTLPAITDFPWHASLYRANELGFKEFICGGTIIQENLVITAAHCVYDENMRALTDSSKLFIATGNLFRSYDSELHDSQTVTKTQVKNVYFKCSYTGFRGNYEYDIAIIEIVRPFQLSAVVRPICLDPEPFDDVDFLSGVSGKVVGFGNTGRGVLSDVLQETTLQIVPRIRCETSVNGRPGIIHISADKFCAGNSNGSTVCYGDSGGGLIFPLDNIWYLRGIVSSRIRLENIPMDQSCSSRWSLFTKVSPHISWIQNVRRRLKEIGSYPSCT